MSLNFWSPKPVPSELPPGLAAAALEVSQAGSQQQALEAAHKLLTDRYHGRRFHTFLKFNQLFRDHPAHLWDHPGPMHCTNLNHLLTILLVHSGWFEPAAIRLRWTNINVLSPHQYVRVRLDTGQIVSVDIWAAAYGLPLGTHAHWFKNGHLWPVRRK